MSYTNLILKDDVSLLTTQTLTDTDTQVTVSTPHDGPTFAVDEYTYMYIISNNGKELVKVIDYNGVDTYTVERGQGGYTAISHGISSKFELRIGTELLNDIRFSVYAEVGNVAEFEGALA